MGTFLVSRLTSMILGRALLSPNSYVDVPARPGKSDFLYTNFLPNFPPLVYHFRKKAPNFDQIGCFYNNLPKIHPVLYNLGSLVSDENPPIAIPNFVTKCPKRQAHNMHHIPCQCENLPCHLNTPHSREIIGLFYYMNLNK